MLTRSGRSLAWFTGLTLATGWFAGYVPLLMLGAACLTVLVVAALWMVSRPRIAADRELRPNRVTEGNAASALLTVTNQGRRRSPAMVVLERFGEHQVPVNIPSLPGGGSFSQPYRLPTDRRGRFAVGPLTVARSDPFQLMRAGQQQRSSDQLWVHPRTYPMEPFPNGKARDLEGPTSAEAPLGGIAFHTLREYVLGDDLRLIHWRSSAKTDTLMVRHNVDTYQPRSLIILDVNASVYNGEAFDEAVRVAASLVLASMRANFPVRLRTTDGYLFSSRGHGSTGQRDALLDHLAALGPNPSASLADLGREVSDELAGLSLAVVTGQAPARDLAVIGPLRARFENITIARMGGRGASVYQLPGALLVNAPAASEFAHAWNRRLRR
jgi:uncharacterized protein (DUF58 family)